jgi:EamA-like transporter family
LQWLGISRHNLLFLVISGIATGSSWIFYFKSLQMIKVSQVAPVDKLSVALTIILPVIFLNEALTLEGHRGSIDNRRNIDIDILKISECFFNHALNHARSNSRERILKRILKEKSYI